MDEDAIFEVTGKDHINFDIYSEDNFQDILMTVKQELEKRLSNHIEYKKGKENLKDFILNGYLDSFEERLALHIDEEGDHNIEFKILGNQELRIDIYDYKPEPTSKKRKKRKP